MSTFANVYVGSAPNDLTGDTLRHAFEIINLNFANIAAGNANIAINSPVHSVAGRTGNVLLSVNDVNGAASLASVIAQTNAANVYANTLYATTTTQITDAVYSEISANLADEIATVASDLVSSGNLLDPLYTDIDLINANVTAANARISTLSSSVGGLTSATSALIAANVVTNANLGTATTNISALQAGATAANAAILTNTNRITAANARITTLASDLNSANNNISVLQANAVSQQNTLIALVANSATQASEINTLTANAVAQHNRIRTLDANLGQATTNIIALTQDNLDQADAINALVSNSVIQSDQLDSLASDITVINNDIGDLIANSAVQSNQIRTLDANLGQATTNIAYGVTAANALRANINAANAAIITANIGVVSYINDLNDAQTANAAAQGGAINTIYANIGTTAINVNTLFANAATQQTQITTINSNVAGANTSIRILSNSIAAANAAIASTNANVTASNIAATFYISTNNANVTAANAAIAGLRANINAANVVMAPVANLDAIIGNLIPITSNTYSIGKDGVKWNEVYAGGNVQTTSYVLAGRAIQTPLTETGNLNANSALIYGEVIVGNISSIPGYGTLSTANLGNVITTGGVFWANGNPYVTSTSPIGNITFTNTTISTADGTTNGIILNSAGAGEIAMLDFVGINNANPGYWLHIGDGAPGATNNTGNISIDFNDGTDALKASTIIDYAWWDASSQGNNNRGIGPHAHFGIYKNDETHANAFIEFDCTSKDATLGANLEVLGNIAYTPATPSDWDTTPTTIAAALDELAARLRAANI